MSQSYGDELAKQLGSFSISSDEDRLSAALSKTYIGSTNNSSFSAASQHNQQQQACTFPPPSQPQQPLIPSPQSQSESWNSNADQDDWKSNVSWASNNANESKDSWGKGPPSYTSIIQGTYFGFNSIMEASNSSAPITTNTNSDNNNNNNKLSINSGSQGFGQFKNNPVSFTLAAEQYRNQ